MDESEIEEKRKELAAMGMSDDEIDDYLAGPDEHELKSLGQLAEEGELQAEENAEQNNEGENDGLQDEEQGQGQTPAEEVTTDPGHQHSGDRVQEETANTPEPDAVADIHVPAFSSDIQPPPDDYDAQLASISEERRQIERQYFDGELEQEDRDKKLDALADRRDELVGGKRAYDAAVSQYHATVLSIQRAAISRFNADHPEYQEGSPLFSRRRTALLRDAIADVEEQAAKAGTTLSPRETLAKAHAAIVSEFGEIKQQASGVRSQQDQQKPQPRQKPEIPPTLGGLPTATNDNPTGNRFEYMDKLTGDAYEAALANLPKAEQDAYLRG